jgi:hypothetical protein
LLECFCNRSFFNVMKIKCIMELVVVLLGFHISFHNARLSLLMGLQNYENL